MEKAMPSEPPGETDEEVVSLRPAKRADATGG
jgi:hypothetical protein